MADNITTAAHENLIKSADIQITTRKIDFVTQFARNWQALQEILGITRPIEKPNGTELTSKYAEGTLQSGYVGEGEFIPRSHFTVKEKPYAKIVVEKFSKEVSIEAVAEHGEEAAINMTDEEFLVQLQEVVSGRFYDYLKTGTMTFEEKTFQMAFAMALGKVKDKFKRMHRNVTGIAMFVNTLDLYAYLGSSEITIQNAFGFTYIKNFLGAEIVFISSEIPRGKMIATPVNNIVSYYVNPQNSGFAKLGLDYTTDGETNLIGFAIAGDYDRATGVSYALMGFTLFAEYIDAIAVVTINPNSTNPESENIPTDNGTLGTLTVTSVAGTSTGDTKLTVSPTKASGNGYKYKVADAATNVTYGQNVQTWTAWDGTSDITAASGKVVTVVECDAGYKAQKAGNATVTAKE